jgi:hypothetical protein
VLILVAFAWLGPRWLEGRAALAWARHHASGALSGQRAGWHARALGRWVGVALERAAPLPDATAAAGLGLDTALRLQRSHPTLARELGGAIAEHVAELRASPWRGVGLASLEKQAREIAARGSGEAEPASR